jgi:hypothetical protein
MAVALAVEQPVLMVLVAPLLLVAVVLAADL